MIAADGRPLRLYPLFINFTPHVNTVVEMIECEGTKEKEDASNQDKKVLIA